MGPQPEEYAIGYTKPTTPRLWVGPWRGRKPRAGGAGSPPGRTPPRWACCCQEPGLNGGPSGCSPPPPLLSACQLGTLHGCQLDLLENSFFFVQLKNPNEDGEGAGILPGERGGLPHLPVSRQQVLFVKRKARPVCLPGIHPKCGFHGCFGEENIFIAPLEPFWSIV